MSFINRLAALLVAGVMFCAPIATTLVAFQPASAAAQTAAPPAAPAPDAAAPAAAKPAAVDQHGLMATWNNSDLVAKATFVILLIMSMGSWYILVVKYFEQRRLMKEGQAAADTFWSAGSLKQGTESLKEDSAFRYIAEQGMKATEHHSGLTSDVDLNEWVTMSVQRASETIGNRLQDGLAFLATVGSTSPFVGLFGTVWGIYGALKAIGDSGQASLDKVAGPVGEALIMTAIGLAVAVPAVLSYNWLVRRNKVTMEKVRAFSGDLHSVLISQAGKKR